MYIVAVKNGSEGWALHDFEKQEAAIEFILKETYGSDYRIFKECKLETKIVEPYERATVPSELFQQFKERQQLAAQEQTQCAVCEGHGNWKCAPPATGVCPSFQRRDEEHGNDQAGA